MFLLFMLIEQLGGNYFLIHLQLVNAIIECFDSHKILISFLPKSCDQNVLKMKNIASIQRTFDRIRAI